MLNRRIFGLVAAAAPLAACADQAMSRSPAMGGMAVAPSPGLATRAGDANALTLQALQGGTFLMQTAQLGEQRARSAPLREFCGFEDAEQRSVMQAMAALTGVQPPPQPLRQDQAAIVSQLQSASAGPNFDRLLVNAQLTGHREALGIYNTIAQNTGEMPGLRAVAIMAVGHINEHVAVLERGLVRGRV
ncbi:DUF4142 domain-containing protein [Roseomonas sp. CCTCC AB2023176]|uniref:DUF4142 domain-containing protein n=1 Tax=Roseomonas sp. CCTCC AB2023176 TaxID=3342640 RepID=UPI0035D93A37